MRQVRGSHAVTRRPFVASSFAAAASSAGFSSLDYPGALDAPLQSETPGGNKIYPGVYQIDSLFGGRNLFQYLFVGDNILLLDIGLAYTPERTIFPALRQLGIRPQQVNLAITTHADGDQQGGNDAIKRASPGTWLACGEADRAMVEDPRTLWDQRYNFLKRDYDVGIDPEPSPDVRKPRRMDACFAGGERIRLSNDWDLEVLHVPGHSHGHLALLDRDHGTAFVGDAIHGRGCPSASGAMALPVTYYYVDVYFPR